jgi:hypothetical protein
LAWRPWNRHAESSFHLLLQISDGSDAFLHVEWASRNGIFGRRAERFNPLLLTEIRPAGNILLRVSLHRTRTVRLPGRRAGDWRPATARFMVCSADMAAPRSFGHGVQATFAHEYEYKRHGPVSLLAGIDLATARSIPWSKRLLEISFPV